MHDFPRMLSPFLIVALAAGAVSLAAIVAGILLPLEYGRYLTFLPA